MAVLACEKPVHSCLGEVQAILCTKCVAAYEFPPKLTLKTFAIIFDLNVDHGYENCLFENYPQAHLLR